MGKPESLIPISGIRELALFRLPPQQCAVCSLPFCLYAQVSGSAVIIEGNTCKSRQKIRHIKRNNQNLLE